MLLHQFPQQKSKSNTSTSSNLFIDNDVLYLCAKHAVFDISPCSPVLDTSVLRRARSQPLRHRECVVCREVLDEGESVALPRSEFIDRWELHQRNFGNERDTIRMSLESTSRVGDSQLGSGSGVVDDSTCEYNWVEKFEKKTEYINNLFEAEKLLFVEIDDSIGGEEVDNMFASGQASEDMRNVKHPSFYASNVVRDNSCADLSTYLSKRDVNEEVRTHVLNFLQDSVLKQCSDPTECVVKVCFGDFDREYKHVFFVYLCKF